MQLLLEKATGGLALCPFFLFLFFYDYDIFILIKNQGVFWSTTLPCKYESPVTNLSFHDISVTRTTTFYKNANLKG